MKQESRRSKDNSNGRDDRTEPYYAVDAWSRLLSIGSLLLVGAILAWLFVAESRERATLDSRMSAAVDARLSNMGLTEELIAGLSAASRDVPASDPPVTAITQATESKQPSPEPTLRESISAQRPVAEEENQTAADTLAIDRQIDPFASGDNDLGVANDELTDALSKLIPEETDRHERAPQSDFLLSPFAADATGNEIVDETLVNPAIAPTTIAEDNSVDEAVAQTSQVPSARDESTADASRAPDPPLLAAMSELLYTPLDSKNLGRTIRNTGGSTAVVESIEFHPQQVIRAPADAVAGGDTIDANEIALDICFQPAENLTTTPGKHGVYKRILDEVQSIPADGSLRLTLSVANSLHIGHALRGTVVVRYNGAQPLIVNDVNMVFVKGQE